MSTNIVRLFEEPPVGNVLRLYAGDMLAADIIHAARQKIIKIYPRETASPAVLQLPIARTLGRSRSPCR
jgi:hypothetical protein